MQRSYGMVDLSYSAIVAQDYNTYWAGVTSNPVRIIRSAPLTLASYFRSSGTVLDVKEDVDERPLSRAEVYEMTSYKMCFNEKADKQAT